jgi:hypothetical protein
VCFNPAVNGWVGRYVDVIKKMILTTKDMKILSILCHLEEIYVVVGKADPSNCKDPCPEKGSRSGTG